VHHVIYQWMLVYLVNPILKNKIKESVLHQCDNKEPKPNLWNKIPGSACAFIIQIIRKWEHRELEEWLKEYNIIFFMC